MSRMPRIEQDARRLCLDIFGVVECSGVTGQGVGWAATSAQLNRVQLFRSKCGGQCADVRMSGDVFMELRCEAATREKAMRRLVRIAKGHELSDREAAAIGAWREHGDGHGLLWTVIPDERMERIAEACLRLRPSVHPQLEPMSLATAAVRDAFRLLEAVAADDPRAEGGVAELRRLMALEAKTPPPQRGDGAGDEVTP